MKGTLRNSDYITGTVPVCQEDRLLHKPRKDIILPQPMKSTEDWHPEDDGTLRDGVVIRGWWLRCNRGEGGGVGIDRGVGLC